MKIKFFDLTALLVFSVMIDYRFFAGEGGIPGFTLTEIVCYGMVFLLFCLFCFRKISFENIVLPVYRSNRPIVMYFGWLFVASVLGIGINSSYEGFWLFKNSFPSLLLYSFVVLFVQNAEHLKKIMWVYLLGASVGFILGVFQGSFGEFYPIAENIATEYKMDISGASIEGYLVRGFQSHPNGFAGFYLPAVILTVVCVWKRLFRGAPRNVFMILLIPVIAFDYYHTYAKGAWAWLLIGILLLFIPKYFEKYRRLIAWFSFSFGIVLMIMVSIYLYSLEGSAFGTVITRLQLWMAGMEAIQARHSILLFGSGGGKTMLSISPFLAGIEYPNTHNGIFNLLLFYGIPALLLFLVGTMIIIRRLSESLLQAGPELKPLGLFSYSSIIALIGIYFFEPLLVGVNMQAHFFLVLAVSLKFIELTKVSEILPEAYISPHE